MTFGSRTHSKPTRWPSCLPAGLAELGVNIMFPVEANAVFAAFPAEMEARLRSRGWHFYNFIGAGGSRLMCSWDTGPEDVEQFLADCRESS